ncbi:MAG: DUF4214 domain-containing protein, partial [Gammaproteobacteria bacterium]|nr:DUF4214 domain-containing protein [Gammaproteobacteria bacterium]
ANYSDALTNEQFVTKIYQNVFNREPDPEGLAFWAGAMNSGINSRGETVVEMFKSLSNPGSEADKAVFDNKVAVGQYFAVDVGSNDVELAKDVLEGITADSTSVDAAKAVVDGEDQAFTLTTGADVATANVFNSADEFVPGTGYVNTLNDNDVLTGTDADDDTLNAQIGTANDINATIEIQPTLNDIEIVNVQFINSGNNEDALNLRDAEGVNTVNINRVADNTNSVDILQMGASVTNVSFNDQTQFGEIGFEHQEEILTGTETLNFTSEDARANGLVFREAGDGFADTGFYFETVNFTTDGNNDFDSVTIQGNGRELILDPTGDYDQTINFTANNAVDKGLEINNLTANGAEFINVEANAGVAIAADNFASLDDLNDGITTNDLETMTITGAADVMIDGIDTTKQETVTLTIHGSTATGDLSLGIESASDATGRDDVDLMVTTGSGNDEVRTYDVLAGSITTGEGNDTVAVRDTVNDNNADMEGVSRIMTGEGDDTVMVRNLNAFGDAQANLLNSGADDAAQIDTGAGNDTITVGALSNATDWDDNDPDDNNADDRFSYVGATVNAGEGDDTLNISGAMAENTTVDMGSEMDTVNYNVAGLGTVLADDDADAREFVSVDETTTAVDASTADIEGAHMILGDGVDSITFTDIDLDESATLLVAAAANVAGSGAKIMGGEGNDTLSVSTTDNMTIVSASNGAAGVDTAAITGIETINLTIENAIDEATATATGLTQTDTNDMQDTTVSLDVLRVDSDLNALNLVSNEDAVMTLTGSEQYESGDNTIFDIDNMRSAVDLTLMAYEATGVVGATNAAVATGALEDDTVLAISTTSATEVVSGAITQGPQHTDVTLDMTYAAEEARGLTDSDSLTITAVDSFDIKLELDTATDDDRIGDAASTTDDDTVLIENFTLTFTDAFSHSVDMSGFGDVDFRGVNDRPAVDAGDVSSTAETSFTLNSGAAAGQRLDIDNVNADTIRIMNADGTAVTAADVTLRVDASNNYDIVTGSGSDIIDMRLDDVRSGDNATAVDRKDSVDAGAGRDTLIINGNDDLGTNNNVAVQVQSMIVDDDVFQELDSIETILIDTTAANNGANGDLMITLDEQAGMDDANDNTNVDTVRMIGNQANKLDLVIGNNFTVGDFNGANTLVIDTAGHRAATTLNIESKDDDTDEQLVNMDILVAAKGGTNLTIVDAGNQENATTEVTVYTADEVDVLTIAEATTALADGIVNINTGYGGTAATQGAGAFDSLTILEGFTNNDNLGNENAITVTVADRWTNTESGFEVDASAVLDTDANTATGGMTLTVQQGDDADLTVQGTQQNDTITTGRG